MKLFEELKRRNVFRMAAVYVAVGWLLTQVAATLEGAIGLPAWFDGMIVALLALGFPLAIIFSWAFEITPDGVKRTSEVDQFASIAARTGRKLDYILLAVAGLAIAVVAADRLAPGKAPVSAPALPADASGDDRSIAVLPFVDLSPAGDQEYFADGLSEELLNVLAQSHDLKVAGRTSSFAFKGQSRDLREVGEILNVGHILEGSVRKSGERIRVTAQLIKASDGYHVFSETYDRQLSDIFAVQDDIAGKIGTALKAKLTGATSEAAAPSDLKVYDLYLLARQRIYSRNPEQMKEAAEMLDRALILDPGYAPVYAQKAIVALLQADVSGIYPDDVAMAASEALINKALALDPDLAEAHAALGLQRLDSGESLAWMRAPLDRALAINPNLTDAQNWLAIALLTHGQISESRQVYESVVARDPLFKPAFNNLVYDYASTGEFEKAEILIARVERTIGGENADTMFSRGLIAFNQGRLAAAISKFKEGYALSRNAYQKSVYGAALIQIGELETAYEVIIAKQKPGLLVLMGRNKEAAAFVEAEMENMRGSAIFMRGVFDLYASTGEYEKVAQYMETNYGDLEKATEFEFYNASHWLGPLGYSYKKLGRERDLANVLAIYKKVLAADFNVNAGGMSLWECMAEIAMLEGDADLAIEHLHKAVGQGWLGAYGFYSPVFNDLRSDPRFVALEADMRVRVNAERAELGLAPI